MMAIGLVPARGGSKGIPRKNLALLGGRPLLAWTAEAALKSQRLQSTILSTDDEEIAAAGREIGLETPFLRPAALSTDSAASIDVVLHAVRWLDEAGRRPDVIVLLQPTAPLRTAGDIDAAVALLTRSGADSVVSVAEVPSHFSPDWQLKLEESGELSLANGRPLREIVTQRQLLKRSYYRNGAIYAVRSEVLLSGRSLYGEHCLGYVMPACRSVNIDRPEDLQQAEQWISNGRV